MLPVIQDIHLLYLFLEHVYAHASSWLRKKKRQKQGRCYVQPYTAFCSSPTLCNDITLLIYRSLCSCCLRTFPFFNNTFWYKSLLEDHQPADLFDRHVEVCVSGKLTKKAYASGSLFPACSASCALLLFELYRIRLTVTN